VAKYIVYNCTGYPGGGLADRFRGIISCYALAKNLNCEFIINWTYPFKLNSVLNPNTTNWLPRPIQGTYRAHRIFDINGHEIYKEALKNHKMFFTEDIHIIETNINFLSDIKSGYNFAVLFNELFNYKLKLPNFINDKTLLGVAARFGGQQANWNDPNFNREVSFEEAYNSIKSNMLYDKQPIFLCSDSSKFLQFCKDKNLNFYETEKKSEHIDYQGCSFEGFIKAFEDFFILRECHTILSLKGNFAITAALSNDKKIIDI